MKKERMPAHYRGKNTATQLGRLNDHTYNTLGPGWSVEWGLSKDRQGWWLRHFGKAVRFFGRNPQALETYLADLTPARSANA